MSLEQLRETAALAPPGASGALRGEGVRMAGLDPSIYLAVLPAECARFGKVNENGRLYPVRDGIAQHERLCEAAKDRFVAGAVEPDTGTHPDGETWRLPIRLIDGSVRIEEDGTATALGRFGVLNTTLGRDLMTLHDAGLPIGVSSNARGRLDPHKLDEASPYAKANADRRGETVKLVALFKLDDDRPYDWVRLPSAGTYVTPPNTSVAEATQRLREAFDQEESPMEIKTLPALVAAYPDLVAAHREQVLREAGESPEVKTLRESANAAAERVKLVEAEVTKITGERDEARTHLGEAQAKAKAAETKIAVTEALDKLIVGKPAGALLKAKVLALFERGRVTSVEEATESFNDYAEVATTGGAQGATGAGVVGGLTEANDGSKNGTGSTGSDLSGLLG